MEPQLLSTYKGSVRLETSAIGSPSLVCAIEDRAMRSALALLPDHPGDVDADLLSKLMTTLEYWRTHASYRELAVRIGLETAEMEQIAARIRVVMHHHRGRQTSSTGGRHYAIACLRLSVHCREPLARLRRQISDPWRSILPDDPRYAGLQGALAAMEYLLRHLVQDCHESPEALASYLHESPVVNAESIHDAYLRELVNLLLDDFHLGRLAQHFAFGETLRYDGSLKKTLRTYLTDICDIRNRVAHVKVVGEDDLLLYDHEALEIIGPLQRAVSKGLLGGISIIDTIIAPLTISTNAPIGTPSAIFDAPAATEVASQPARQLSPDAIKRLKGLQQAAAARFEGGQHRILVTINALPTPFVLVPTPGLDRRSYLYVSRKTVSTADGRQGLSREDIARAVARAATKPGVTVRLPRADECLELLAPLGDAASNPFGLDDVEPSRPQWVQDEGGRPRLLHLLHAGPCETATGAARWVLEFAR